MFSKTSFLQLILLSCIFLFPNCKKDSDGDPGDGPTSEYFFSASLDGQTVLYEIDQSGNNEMVNSNDGNVNPPDCSYSYGCSLGPTAANAPYFEVSFQNLFSGDCAEIDAAFSGLFHPGPFPIGLAPGSVLISYWDGTEQWTSTPNGQQNASFKITASERQETPFGVYQKVGGEASCRLFNAAGQSKNLENAKFSLSFSQE